MIPPFATNQLFELLKSYKSSPFIVVESGGNWGDDLIYLGAKKIFNYLNINYKVVDHHEFMALEIPEDTVVYINGGGAFNELWIQYPIIEFVKSVTSSAKAVIVGPTTFTIDQDFLKQRAFSKNNNTSSQKVFIFCRENISYQTLKDIVPTNFDLLIDHDTAFNNSAEDLLKEIPHGKYKLYAIREDKEGHPIEKLDLLGLWAEPIHAPSFNEWIALHANANKVITNRLHSSIVCSILGKNVTLLPNSYYKNRSGWEDSLKDKGVRWQENLEVSPFEKYFMKSNFYKWLAHSHKVRKSYGLI